MSDSQRSVFITGAATGIGLAIAKKLDGLGWRVFAGINNTPPTELLRDASDRLTTLRVDVTDGEQVKRAADAVCREVGERGLSLLISNAALAAAAQGPVETVSIDDFKRLMEINFWGPLRVTQAFLPMLRAYGRSRIIIVTSASVHLTIPIGGSYAVTKCALTALTQHLRMEMAPFGIEVTALEPGGVATPMTAGPPEEEVRFWNAIPMPLRQRYDAAFTYPGKAIKAGFEFESPESFADKVYDRIITAKKLKPRYTLGKGVAMLPVMHRVLPRRTIEKIFGKLFQVKRTS